MAVWPYSTAQWQRLRLAKLAETPNCQPCAERGRLVLANVVDHVTAIAAGGDPFPALDGLNSLCGPCHSAKTAARDNPYAFGGGGPIKGSSIEGVPLDAWHPFNGGGPPAIEWMPSGLLPSVPSLTIVAGPPASGKSTFVGAHAGPADLIIDLDVIASRIARTGLHAWPKSVLPVAIKERNMQLRALGRGGDPAASAWFIISQAEADHRQAWRDRLRPARVVILETPADVCIDRLRADPQRSRSSERIARAVRAWWSRYSPLADEERIVASG